MDIGYLLNQIKTDKIFLFKSFYRWFYFGIMIAGLVLVLSGVDFYFNKSPSTDSWELIVLNSIVVVAGMLTGRVVLFLLGNLIGMALFSWLFTRHKYEQNIRIFSVVASVFAIIILKYSLIDKYSLVFTYPFVIVLIILIDLLVIWPRTTHHFSYRRKPGYLARLRSRSIYLAGISLVLSGIDLNFNKSVSINFENIVLLNSIVSAAGMFSGWLVYIGLKNRLIETLFSSFFTKQHYLRNIGLFSTAVSLCTIFFWKNYLYFEFGLVFTYPYLVILLSMIIFLPRQLRLHYYASLNKDKPA